jgi:heme/copper-type cytochrome/quinol oxidase subunit 3
MSSLATEPHATPAHVHAPPVFPRDPQFGLAGLGKIAMWLFLLSDAFSFFGLLLGYGILKGRATVWHHPGEPALSIPFTALLTFVLICSSLTMVLAWEKAARNDRPGATRFLLATAALGTLFLIGQYQEWFGIAGHGGLMREGLVFGKSAYASTFYVITGFHGLHVTAGVIYILLTVRRHLGGRATASELEVLGLFWHFIDLVWLLVFTLVYLLP